MLPRPAIAEPSPGSTSSMQVPGAHASRHKKRAVVRKPSSLRRVSSRSSQRGGKSEADLPRTSSEAAMHSSNIWTDEDLGLKKPASVKQLVKRLSSTRLLSSDRMDSGRTDEEECVAVARAARIHDDLHAFLDSEATFVDDHDIDLKNSPSHADAHSALRRASMAKRASMAEFKVGLL